MRYKVITKCPACESDMEVIKVHCPHCNTSCEGRFILDKFSYLRQDQKHFIEVFLKCRGNIKDVEKELNISYPTVRNRLDEIIKSLGYEVSSKNQEDVDRGAVLKMLERGEIDVEEAIARLKK